jgi:hypothetical protein
MRSMITYEVRVHGEVPRGLVHEFGDLQAVVPAGTTFEVDVPDPAALLGLIDALRAAGVELLEVRRLNAQSPASPE